MLAAPMEYEVAMSELARRQYLLETLQQNISLTAPPTNLSGVGGGTMNAMHSMTGGILGGRGGGGSGSGYQPLGSSNPNPSLTSERALVQRQEDIIKLQDDMLEDIGKGVEGLKHKAQVIGEEAKIHVRLLDDPDGNVELATAGLQSETKHAEAIRTKTRMCYMYICVALQVVIMVILAVIAFSRH